MTTLTFHATSSHNAIVRGIRAHLTQSNSTLVSTKDLGMVRDPSAGLVRQIQLVTNFNGSPTLDAYR